MSRRDQPRRFRLTPASLGLLSVFTVLPISTHGAKWSDGFGPAGIVGGVHAMTSHN